MARDLSQESIEPPQKRIDSGTGKLMTATALGLDSFQGILGIAPFVGWVLSPMIGVIIWLTFWIWLKLHGVSIVESVERMAILFGGFLVELVPILNILPVWTLTIFVTVLLVQREDKKKIKEFYENIKT